MRMAYAISRSYLRELALRTPADCAMQRFVHENLARLALLELKPDEARREIDAAPSCDQPLTLHAASLLTDISRLRPRTEDVPRVRRDMAALRATRSLGTGSLALADCTEGRMLLASSPAEARPLLERAIAEAARQPTWDEEANKARGFSYSGLIMDDGKAGRFDRALRLFAAEVSAPEPQRCAVGVAVDDERSLIAVRGADGRASGSFDGARREDMDKFQPRVAGPLLEALRGCPVVDVFARPPLQGRLGLLPPDVAWRYRAGPGAAAPSNRAARRLVVADVEPPVSLSLPRLGPWSGAGGAGDVELRGLGATPARVLAEMADATEIEIHAHGIADLTVSDASLIVLSPDRDGSYALTAGEVRARKLSGAPLVVLAACRSAQPGTQLHAAWSLPVSFLRAGARAVLAATADVNDAQAQPFFDGVRARVRAGADPAAALRDERMAWAGRPGADWAQTVLLFQ
jgi:hypothetical protein